LGYARVDAEIARAFDEAVAVLHETGATLEAASPGFASPASIIRRLFAARAAWTVRKLSEAQRAELDPVVAAAAVEGMELSAVDALNAEAERVALIQTMAEFHNRFDVLLTPASAYAAPLTHAQPPSERGSFAAPFSLTRQPALSIPCGFTKAGLPIGLQIVGRSYEDATVLAVASAYERLRPFRAPAL
jgi:aspartyl-tRNA(Asn)/glutamyl-tRNA(Gln) amidotransferase subunit A